MRGVSFVVSLDKDGKEKKKERRRSNVEVAIAGNECSLRLMCMCSSGYSRPKRKRQRGMKACQAVTVTTKWSMVRWLRQKNRQLDRAVIQLSRERSAREERRKRKYKVYPLGS